MTDYIIIGCGPTGLTLAYCLSKLNKKIILLDEAPSIGGCHRVIRVNSSGSNNIGLFTEHAPRIYSSAYINTQMLLRDFNSSFYDIFTPYDFPISTIGTKTLSNITLIEKYYLALEFIKLLLNPNHGKDISMKKFMTIKNFSQSSQNYIDRLCRLTDGAGMLRYTLFELLSLFNEQIFQKIYQPKLPNDIGLFKIWETALASTNNVTILLNARVNNINYTSNNSFTVTYIDLVNPQNNPIVINGSSVICAIPPYSLLPILANSPDLIKNSFNQFAELKYEATETNYITDLSMTFHWSHTLNLPQIWGFPASEWGVGFIVLSNYMKFDDPRSLTVISLTLTKADSISTRLGKTALNTSASDLIKETWLQLQESFPNLPYPDYPIINPRAIWMNETWINQDTAYVATNMNITIKSQSSVPNLWSIGTHNGYSLYHFTSMESAVTNALKFIHQQYPDAVTKWPIKQSLTAINVICIVVIIIILIISIVLIIKYK